MNEELTLKYIRYLEELLLEVRNTVSLDLTSEFKLAGINYDFIDDYIAELNSYYYRTFHEHFFPFYRKAITTDTEELLQIKRNQTMIAQDLLANIKRYAKLYNQVKVVNQLLADTREDFNNSLYTVYREKEQQSTELSYLLKNFYYSINSLQDLTKTLTILYRDKELLNAVKLYPNMPRVLVNTSKLAPSELDIVRRLIVRLKVVFNLVKQLQNHDISKKVVQGIIDDFTSQIKAINNDRTWSTMPKPFIIDFNFKVETFKELISAYNELNKLDKIRQTAKQYEKQVHNFLLILDAGLDFLEKNSSKHSEDLLSNCFAIIDLTNKSLQRLTSTVSAVKGNLDRLQDNILQTGEPDFAYLAKTIENLLHDYRERFQQHLQHEDIMQIPPLAKQLNIANLEFSILERHLNALKEKHTFSQSVEEKYLGLINVLDSYLSFISNTRGDLERILAPRNLSRIWKGFNVKIERLPLEVGKKLAPDYMAILEATTINRRISPLDTDTILHEEGDIFIITIDDMTVYEIPPLTLAQKG